jgi:hypothetical protein
MNTPQPLDPNSTKGRETAERLTQVLAEIRVAIAARRARATSESEAAA